ncbi:alpha-amylase family glycosyl hydrolase [Hymenobacter convexus]|uniref:alpha-amylase family glycosyl hydrolase n=1 Tax=Hymenobacter sp. CA1UV-4 TaxID=3063782 RepID=UPI002713E364|nr:alpha-amylase family glycosyl hydrolase [Hymenobacter sp. CA1UV-4]MDO7850583.1 alpha-amylase family glycosyl hydrolase [Hymenobacter sp. CA1UV-4]
MNHLFQLLRPPLRPRLLLYLLLLECLWGGCKQPSPEPPASEANISPLPALSARDAVLYEVFVPDFSAAGTFDGMLPRLDSLQKLGVNTLWLMPLHPTHNSPYAVDDYGAVNRELGDLAAFDRLVAAAHQRGLRVLLDWVANHTSYYHPWVQQHPDWYTRDANGQIVHPNPQWTDVADLNYNRPELRQAMTAAMKTWVTGHAIDGFRCDAADLVPDDYWQAAIAELRQANPNLFFLAEGSQTSHYAAGFQLTFGWDFYNALQRVVINQAPTATLAAAHAAELQNVPAGSYRLRFTTNHDEVQQGTPAARFGSEAAARAAYVATLAFGAAPLLYNGQEAGDPAQLNSPTRTPIRWNNDPTAGPFYRGLLRVYNDQPALRYGLVEYFDQAPGAVVVRHRLGAQEVLVLVNLRSSAVSVPLPAVSQGAAWTNSLTRTAVGSPAAVPLAAYGYAVWQR